MFPYSGPAVNNSTDDHPEIMVAIPFVKSGEVLVASGFSPAVKAGFKALIDEHFPMAAISVITGHQRSYY